MLLALLLHSALAGSAAPVQPLSGGQTASTIFARTSLATVGTVQCSKKRVEVKCGTVQGVKTCSLGDTATHEVFMTTTNIQIEGLAFKLTTGTSFCDEWTILEFR